VKPEAPAQARRAERHAAALIDAVLHCLDQGRADDVDSALDRVLSATAAAHGQLPGSAALVAAAVAHRQRIDPAAHAALLQRLRTAALDALVFFQPFCPRLVGAIADGYARAESPLDIQVFSDDHEALLMQLDQHAIRWRSSGPLRRTPRGRCAPLQRLDFEAGGRRVQLALFSYQALRAATVPKGCARANAALLASWLGGDQRRSIAT